MNKISEATCTFPNKEINLESSIVSGGKISKISKGRKDCRGTYSIVDHHRFSIDDNLHLNCVATRQ